MDVMRTIQLEEWDSSVRPSNEFAKIVYFLWISWDINVADIW